jgi:hypothetical protein
MGQTVPPTPWPLAEVLTPVSCGLCSDDPVHTRPSFFLQTVLSAFFYLRYPSLSCEGNMWVPKHSPCPLGNVSFLFGELIIQSIQGGMTC